MPTVDVQDVEFVDLSGQIRQGTVVFARTCTHISGPILTSVTIVEILAGTATQRIVPAYKVLSPGYDRVCEVIGVEP